MLESKELLGKILKTKNLTIYKLSKISGIPRTTLVDLAEGKTSLYNASLKTVNKLASFLGISVEELLKGNITQEDDLKDLPQNLIDAINKMNEAFEHLEKNDGYTMWDIDFCELQSEINIAEVDGIISSERAWELRTKYLKILRG